MKEKIIIKSSTFKKFKTLLPTILVFSQKPNDKRIFVELNNSDQFFQNMLSNKNKFLGFNIMSSVNSVEINCAVAKDDTEYIYDKMKISYESWKHNPNLIIE